MTLNLVPQIIEYETGFILSCSQNYSNSFELQFDLNLFSDDKVNLYLSRVLSRPRSDNSLMIF